MLDIERERERVEMHLTCILLFLSVNKLARRTTLARTSSSSSRSCSYWFQFDLNVLGSKRRRRRRLTLSWRFVLKTVLKDEAEKCFPTNDPLALGTSVVVQQYLPIHRDFSLIFQQDRYESKRSRVLDTWLKNCEQQILILKTHRSVILQISSESI